MWEKNSRCKQSHALWEVPVRWEKGFWGRSQQKMCWRWLLPIEEGRSLRGTPTRQERKRRNCRQNSREICLSGSTCMPSTSPPPTPSPNNPSHPAPSSRSRSKTSAQKITDECVESNPEGPCCRARQRCYDVVAWGKSLLSSAATIQGNNLPPNAKPLVS